jgi:acyl-coenzyme A thioesterase 7
MTEEDSTSVSTIAKIMLPDEANLAGNVHGGSILKLIEEAGLICAQRYLVRTIAEMRLRTSAERASVRAALARVDTMAFKAPAHIGECMVATAHVSFTSAHSIEVMVHVVAENAAGAKRNTNSATLVYVPIQLQLSPTVEIIGVVPPKKLVLAPDAELVGQARHAALKASLQNQRSVSGDEILRHVDRCELSQLVLPSDCDQFGFLRGGVLMKLMDNCAGIAAFRHCRSNVVTACVEAIDFRVPVRVGNLIKVVALPTFASARSLEIELCVSAENLLTAEVKVSVTAFFIFVGLTATGSAMTLPPLTPSTPDAVERFTQGARRYELRKQRR